MSYPVVCHIPAAAPAAVQLCAAAAAAAEIEPVQRCAAAVLMGVADVDVVGPVYVC